MWSFVCNFFDFEQDPFQGYELLRTSEAYPHEWTLAQAHRIYLLV